LFFSVIFDEEICFSTFPFCRKTHWGTPFFRSGSRQCRKGDDLGFHLKIGDIRFPGTWTLRVPE
jgi:hypothetical protein